jgi:AcrR family transcriptional regulator
MPISQAPLRLFLEHGYGVTTVAEIATDAGVSVDAIYKGFGGKPGLVRAIYDRGLKGLGPIPAYQRSDEMRTREKDPVTIMRKRGELTAEVASTLTPIRLLMRAAATDDVRSPPSWKKVTRIDSSGCDRTRGS